LDECGGGRMNVEEGWIVVERGDGGGWKGRM
jgi:hypothetical protein